MTLSFRDLSPELLWGKGWRSRGSDGEDHAVRVPAVPAADLSRFSLLRRAFIDTGAALSGLDMDARGSSQARNPPSLLTRAPRARRRDRRRSIAAFAYLLAACTSTAAPPTTEAVPVTTAPVTVSTTTTESAAPHVIEPVDICPRGLVWAAGTTYFADCFVMSVTLHPTEAGWRSVSVGAEWIEGTWIEPGTSEPALQFVLLAYESSRSPEDVIGSIVDAEGVNAITEARPATVAGRTGVQVDVVTEAGSPTAGQSGRPGCTTTLTHSLNLLFGERPGFTLLDRIDMGGGGSLYGLGACLAFRIWAIDVDGITLTLIAAAPDADRLADVAERTQSLFDSAVFGPS